MGVGTDSWGGGGESELGNGGPRVSTGGDSKGAEAQRGKFNPRALWTLAGLVPHVMTLGVKGRPHRDQLSALSLKTS